MRNSTQIFAFRFKPFVVLMGCRLLKTPLFPLQRRLHKQKHNTFYAKSLRFGWCTPQLTPPDGRPEREERIQAIEHGRSVTVNLQK